MGRGALTMAEIFAQGYCNAAEIVSDIGSIGFGMEKNIRVAGDEKGGKTKRGRKSFLTSYFCHLLAIAGSMYWMRW